MTRLLNNLPASDQYLTDIRPGMSKLIKSSFRSTSMFEFHNDQTSVTETTLIKNIDSIPVKSLLPKSIQQVNPSSLPQVKAVK